MDLKWHQYGLVTFSILPFCVVVLAASVIQIVLKRTHILFFIQFLMLFGNVLLSHTVFAGYPVLLLIIQIFGLVLCIHLITLTTSPSVKSAAKPGLPLDSTITNFRSSLFFVTAFSISAVDFSIFPNYFPKTKTYGFGLMDTGVGLFIIVLGMVKTHKVKKGKAIMILLFGILRSVLMLVTDYPGHVIEEYGMHWNFFYTLLVVELAIDTILEHLTCTRALIASLTIIGMQEILLSAFGLKFWLLSPNRSAYLLDQNREGVVSCIGFLGLCLFGNYLKSTMQQKRCWEEQILSLMRLTVVSGCMLIVACWYIDLPCRRTCNLSYYFWMCNFTCLQLSVLIICFGCMSKLTIIDLPPSPYLLQIINKNSLLYFILGNILTGMINMMLPTKSMTPTAAVITLTGYMFITNCVIHVKKYLSKT